MKFSKVLNEANTPKDIILDIHSDYKYDHIGDRIESICQKVNPRASSFDDLTDKDFAKVKTELEKEIKDMAKASIYNVLDGEIPEKLNVSLTKREFKDSLKTVGGRKIPVDNNGMPYEDDDNYEAIMDFYKKHVK